MSVHPKYEGARTSWGINALGSCVVEVEADDGTTGVGVTTAGEPGCYIVEKHLSRFVEGADPRDVERLYDQMWRATTNYGRKGLPLQAISAVDLALWDLLGKLRNEPVYALLGGKTKDRLPVYCTSARPEVAKALGFAGAKIPCPYGPAHGEEGFAKNVAYFAKQRELVGPDFPLALDCYMALTVPYAIRLARALEPCAPHAWRPASRWPCPARVYARPEHSPLPDASAGSSASGSRSFYTPTTTRGTRRCAPRCRAAR